MTRSALPIQLLKSTSRPMHFRRAGSWLALLAITVALVVVPATAAFAKSFWIADADVDITVNADGSLAVVETITFDFDGSFTGAYRDIPLRTDEFIAGAVVSDSSGPYTLGGCTTLGCSSPAGTYGVESIPGAVRIVWHHSSTDTLRTFTISYTMLGVASVYDDVVDVNVQVWGDQWAVGVDRLDARIHIPGDPAPGDVLVWGHPFGINGSTDLGSDGVSPTLEASDVPAERWVELRSVFPSDLISSAAGARIVAGDGLEKIKAEETQFAEDVEAAQRNAFIGFLIGVGAVLVVGLGLGFITYLRYGKEPKVDYDLDYEHGPPTDLHPAEVGALLSQGKVTEKEFTATLFELIREGAINAEPTSSIA